MSDKSAYTDDERLLEVRAEIDGLDRAILDAIERRAGLAAKVSAAKSGMHTFRPGREADLIRRLIAKSVLPPPLIERIWRQIIGGNLTSQMPLKIAIIDRPEAMAAANFRFGPSAEINRYSSNVDVISAVADGACHLGILPHWTSENTKFEKNGFDALIDARANNRDVYISSISPHLSGHGVVDAVIIAQILPDKSAADQTLVAAGSSFTVIEGHQPDATGIIGIIQKRDLS